MKKLFIALICALLCSISFIGCEKEDYLIGKTTPQTEVYVNREYIIDTMSGWTKANVNGNTWNSIPDYPSAAEITGILAYIATNPVDVAWPNFTRYFVQQIGGANHMYSYIDNNGALHTNINGTTSQEMLQIKELDNHWQYVYNFNGGQCNNGSTHNCTMMENGFIDAKTMNEYSSSIIHQWKLFYWNGNYYLGFDFSSVKSDGIIQPDGTYDDWVVKIIPIETSNTGGGSGDSGSGDTGGNTGGSGNTGGTGDSGSGNTGGSTGGSTGGTTNPTNSGVEVDIHQQDHSTWGEIKTSVHIREVSDVEIYLPIEEDDYIMSTDDFAIRYYIPSIEVNGVSTNFQVVVNHTTQNTVITISGITLPILEAYNNEITIEVHSYYTIISDQALWQRLRNSTVSLSSTTAVLTGQIHYKDDPRTDWILLTNQ